MHSLFPLNTRPLSDIFSSPSAGYCWVRDGVLKSRLSASSRCHVWTAFFNTTVGLKTDLSWPYSSDPVITGSISALFLGIIHSSPEWQLRVAGPHDPGVYFWSFLPPISLPVAIVDWEHLAMILEQASDSVQRLCVHAFSLRSLRWGCRSEPFRCPWICLQWGDDDDNPPRHPVYYPAGLFTLLYFPESTMRWDNAIKTSGNKRIAAFWPVCYYTLTALK